MEISIDSLPVDITLCGDLIEVAVLGVHVTGRACRAGGEVRLGVIERLHKTEVSNLCLQTKGKKVSTQKVRPQSAISSLNVATGRIARCEEDDN